MSFTPSLVYQCNLCGAENSTPFPALDRETPSCGCGSNVRFRSLVSILSRELFGRSLPLAQFPSGPDIRGLGMSDWSGYADRLAERLDYRTTFYDVEPVLDIQSIPEEMAGAFDFVIASEVFEHVVPPLQKAFDNLRRMLRDGGFVVFSVPYQYQPGAATKEHFPDLHDFRIEDHEGRPRLVNRTTDGREQVYDDLCFHGGPGQALELRLFALDDLRRHFARAGFRELEICSEPDFEHGIYWAHPWSVPMIVRTRATGRGELLTP